MNALDNTQETKVVQIWLRCMIYWALTVVYGCIWLPKIQFVWKCCPWDSDIGFKLEESVYKTCVKNFDGQSEDTAYGCFWRIGWTFKTGSKFWHGYFSVICKQYDCLPYQPVSNTEESLHENQTLCFIWHQQLWHWEFVSTGQTVNEKYYAELWCHFKDCVHRV